MKKIAFGLLHIGYWALYIFLLLIFERFMRLDFGRKMQDFHLISHSTKLIFASGVVPALLCFYSFYIFLFSMFLQKRKIVSLFISGILIAIFCAMAGELTLYSIFPDMKFFNNGINTAIDVTILISFIALLNGGMGLLIKGFITSYSDIKLKEDLAQKNSEMELALIRSQINPHFLFNTINNIDVLIERDSVKASSYLNKLSDIMRFMLYETKAEEIPLEKELAYIEKYIELQKIRTSNPDYVSYSVEGNPFGKMIAPMIFIPFVENAFKHAGNKKIQYAISILIRIEKDKIIFECKNYFERITEIKSEQSGLGNELIKKRLMLLYPKKHVLEIKKEDLAYDVKLVIANED